MEWTKTWSGCESLWFSIVLSLTFKFPGNIVPKIHFLGNSFDFRVLAVLMVKNGRDSQQITGA